MNKKAEITDKQNGYRFNVKLFESDDKLYVFFSTMGWTFANVEFEKPTLLPTFNTDRHGICNMWQVAAIFGNKENMVEYARVLIA